MRIEQPDRNRPSNLVFSPSVWNDRGEDHEMAETTVDHEEIRKWAERRGGRPAAVKSSHKGGDVGIVRIMFPDSPQSEHDSLVEISWEEFFRQFEESELALLYEKDSMFSKIVGRDTVERRKAGEHDAAR